MLVPKLKCFFVILREFELLINDYQRRLALSTAGRSSLFSNIFNKNFLVGVDPSLSVFGIPFLCFRHRRYFASQLISKPWQLCTESGFI